MTVAAWLAEAQAALTAAGIGTARLDCLVLLEDATHKDRGWLLAHGEDELATEVILDLNTKITQRQQHRPLAYIRTKTEFYGRDFFVDERVLEPRPESETMIDELKKLALPAGAQIADIGCGSGALGISAGLEIAGSQISLIDISADALAVSRHNANAHQLAVTIIETDLLTSLDKSFDVLLCNLPYVPNDYPINKAARHEPALAIFGGADGLDLYRRLFSQTRATYILTEALPAQHTDLTVVAQGHDYELVTSNDFIQVFRRLVVPSGLDVSQQ